jgi:2-polyprenyl-6-methoxyphenol hydroxylase-like FAD-dependent oxidoreductase
VSVVNRIACIGAGPGGLFFAILAKGADPTREVTEFDRNRRDDTFGELDSLPGWSSTSCRRT